MSEAIWFPADLMYSYPVVAFIPAIGLGFYYLFKRGEHPSPEFHKDSLLLLVSTIIWIFFGVLEGIIFMWEQGSSGVGATIRVDVFLVYPVLIITIPMAVISIRKVNKLPDSSKS